MEKCAVCVRMYVCMYVCVCMRKCVGVRKGVNVYLRVCIITLYYYNNSLGGVSHQCSLKTALPKPPFVDFRAVCS